MIIVNCHRIRDGFDVEADNDSKDFFILDRGTPEAIRETIVDLVSRRLGPAYQVDRVRDIQVICALREKTALGCGPMNEELQKKLNPNPESERGVKFRIGDKVIQLKNELVTDQETLDEVAIANGDIGYVERIEASLKGIFVRFENPSRYVKVPLRDNALDHAYAITCHKFQGSEAPIVVIPIHSSAGPLILQRPWLYTAVARAQRVCILVGQRSEIPKIIARNRPEHRFTNLVEFLLDEEVGP
jgi:exodeoxyribonuclease V alpha subunit